MSDKVSRKRLFKSLRDAVPVIHPQWYHEIPETKPVLKQQLVDSMGIKNTLPHTTKSLVKREHAINQARSWCKPTMTELCDRRRTIYMGYIVKDFRELGQLSLNVYLYRGIYLASTYRIGDPDMVLMHTAGRWCNITTFFE